MNHLIKGLSSVSLRCVSQKTTTLFYIPNISNQLSKNYIKSTTILNNNNNNNTQIRQLSTNIFSQALKETKEKEAAAAVEETEQIKLIDNKTDSKTVTLSLNGIGYSQWKLMPVFKAIRGLNHKEAIGQLSFCNKQPSKKVRGLIKQAAHIAEVQKQMDPDRLIVNQIWLGRSFYKKSVMYKGRGQASMIRRPFCHVTVELKEVPYVEGEKKLGRFGKTHKTYSKYDGTFQYNKKY